MEMRCIRMSAWSPINKDHWIRQFEKIMVKAQLKGEI